MDKVTLPTKKGLIEKAKFDEVNDQLFLLKEKLLNLENENLQLKAQCGRLESEISEFDNFEGRVKEKVDAKIEELKNEIRLEFSNEIHDVDQWIQNSQKELVSNVTQNIQDIIFLAVSKILGENLTKRDVPFSVIQNVLEGLVHHKNIILKVAPRDFVLVERYKPRLKALNDLKIISDDSVKLGGCIVELDHAIFDGRVEAQLESIHQSLQNAKGS